MTEVRLCTNCHSYQPTTCFNCKTCKKEMRVCFYCIVDTEEIWDHELFCSVKCGQIYDLIPQVPKIPLYKLILNKIRRIYG